MKLFHIIISACFLLIGCAGTEMNIEVVHRIKTSKGYLYEAQQHHIAQKIGFFQRPRWGNQGVRLISVSNMLSSYMHRSMWCFEDFVGGIHVAKCTTKWRLDSVAPYENVYFTYVYFPSARNAGIVTPIFIDEALIQRCYYCRRW